MLCMEAFLSLSFVKESPGLSPLISNGPSDLIPLPEASCKPAVRTGPMLAIPPPILKIQVTMWFPLAFSPKISPLIVKGTFLS